MRPGKQKHFLSAHCKMLLLFLVVLFSVLQGIAQKNYVTGIITDTSAKKNLQYCIAALIDQADSTLYTSVRSDELGEFRIANIPAGKYTLLVSYPHMADYLQQIIITDTSKIKLGKIPMVTMAVLLQEVVVRSGQAIRMRGDTLEYTADSFALRPGANVEDLLKRLPGIQIDRNGKIMAQGKEVKKILVDGDEFFSEDPGLAAHFLNADAVDKVQVFDQKSDATQFTGVDDGQRTKTINLKLKSNRKNGAFGKVSAGSDGKDYYNDEAMAALFKGAKKISVFGLASKTGKAGIASGELNKYVAQDYERIDDGSGYSFFGYTEYESENYFGNGLPSVDYGGAHYSNKWNGGKQKLYSNYRIKQINAAGWNTSNGTFLMPDGTSFYNRSDSRETSNNFVQKGSGSFATALDSFSTVKISMNGDLSSFKKNTGRNSFSKNEKDHVVNNSHQSGKELSDGENFAANISYQRKFRKEGRTLSFNAQQSFNDVNADRYNYSNTNYFDPVSGILTKADTLDQRQNTKLLNKVFAAKLSVSEKLSGQLSMIVEYGWKSDQTESRFNTFSNSNGNYLLRIDTLSNNYQYSLNTNITGAAFTWNRKKMMVTVGTKLYFTRFNQIDNDLNTERRRNFTNLAPQVTIRIPLKISSSITLNYSGRTFQPTADQLQPLRKSSNSAYVQIGNPDLLPGFSHNASLGYYTAKGEKNFSFNSSMYYSENYVSAKTTTDAQNKTIVQFVNLNSAPVFYGSVQYGWAYKKLHLHPSVYLSFSGSGSNSILNGITIKNKSYSGSFGSGWSYDLTNKLSARYTAGLNFSKSRSNISSAQYPVTLSHSHKFDIKAYMSKKLELSSNCNFDLQPANSAFNSSFNTVRWDAEIVRKILKNNKGYVKLTVNDILNSNTGYRRYMYGPNVYESDRLVLKRYFLLTVGWDFSKSTQ